MFKRLLAAFSLLLALVSTAALAQIDPMKGLIGSILQQGRETGAIYVAPGQDPCRYVEHWFLFEDYVYPSARNGASFAVEPADEEYGGLQGFLREMKALHPQGTHVEVFSAERREGCE